MAVEDSRVGVDRQEGMDYMGMVGMGCRMAAVGQQ